MKFLAKTCDDKNAPLIIFVHGRGGHQKVMELFGTSIPFEKSNMFFPEAPIADPTVEGYSWWLIDEDLKGNWEDINQAAQHLEIFIKEVCAENELTPSKIFGIGFSQGGALLSYVAQRNPHLFTGVGMLASFVLKSPEGFAGQSAPKFFIAHGTRDETVPFERALEGKAWLESQGVEVVFTEDDTTHKVGSNGMKGLKGWLRSFE